MLVATSNSDRPRFVKPLGVSMTLKEKATTIQRKKIVWVSFLILDTFLHKTSRIEILRHLSKRGYVVYLIAVQSKKKFELKNPDINVISIPLRYVPAVSPLLFSGILLFLLPYYIISLKPDYIVTGPGMPVLSFVWARIFYRFRRLKFVLDIRSTPVEATGLQGFLNTFWFNVSVFAGKKFFDGITIITSLMKKEVCDKFRIDPRNVGIWTSGVSLALFDPDKFEDEGMELRRKFCMNDKFVVFYHGNFGPKRGITECIEGIKILNGNNDSVLFLLGTGPALSEMERMIQMFGIQDKVIIHRPVDYEDVPKYIAMCDVGIVTLPDLPDWRHQCPLKLLEYLSMKKAVIITDIPAHREVVGKNKCGIYIPSVDAKGIAEAITYAHNNRDKLREFGEIGRAIINEKYSWKKVAGDFDHYLTSLEKRSDRKL